MQSSALLGSASVTPETDTLRRETTAELDRLWKAIGTNGLTDAEITAGIIKVDLAWPPGDIRRYGAVVDGATNDAVAWQQALEQNNLGGPAVTWWGNSGLASELSIRSGNTVAGIGRSTSIITYTGSGRAFRNNTGGRIYSVLMRDFLLQDTGTGTVGLDLEDVSNGDFRNLTVTGFATGIEIDSTTAGFAVYNRFDNVIAANATIGIDIQNVQSNAHTFTGCRAHTCTTGVLITDSNDNTFFSCQFEVDTQAVSLVASSPGACASNRFIANRFESNTNNISIGTDVTTTWLAGNLYATAVPYVDNGTRTMAMEILGAYPNFFQVAPTSDANGSAYTFVRTAAASTNPAFLINDSNTGSGTPTTLNVNTERAAGKFFSGTRAGNEYSYLDATGRLMLSGAAPTVAAGQVGYGATTATTVGAAGGAAGLPATPTGYLIINVAGTAYKVPYYAS